MPRSNPERRRFPRFPLENDLTLRRSGGDGPGVPAHTLDISAGGCRVVSEAPLAAGTEVELVISLGDRPIRALGRVVYEQPLRSARFQAGVEFLRLDPENRETLANLLRERSATVSS